MTQSGTSCFLREGIEAVEIALCYATLPAKSGNTFLNPTSSCTSLWLCVQSQDLVRKRLKGLCQQLVTLSFCTGTHQILKDLGNLTGSRQPILDRSQATTSEEEKWQYQMVFPVFQWDLANKDAYSTLHSTEKIMVMSTSAKSIMSSSQLYTQLSYTKAHLDRMRVKEHSRERGPRPHKLHIAQSLSPVFGCFSAGILHLTASAGNNHTGFDLQPLLKTAKFTLLWSSLAMSMKSMHFNRQIRNSLPKYISAVTSCRKSRTPFKRKSSKFSVAADLITLISRREKQDSGAWE